ncbi:uncharacterized protein LY79DRAFT_288185 [Colletotrichum navitas]|uniref:Uncharacterized protein n=1 Tax=Colletotrichum navitas TaxID=681940 RepID=A0AAD8QBU3_9PEZI|nr:uncharacterized protein LY79DRAFT_288185 [Colletotrichum navitas]KAK1598423.1 hypothetical protein LY79DRAFT_288185 [Colletotrichum navitas]
MLAPVLRLGQKEVDEDEESKDVIEPPHSASWDEHLGSALHSLRTSESAPEPRKSSVQMFLLCYSPPPRSPPPIPLDKFSWPPSIDQQGQVKKRLVRRNTRHATPRHAEKAKTDPSCHVKRHPPPPNLLVPWRRRGSATRQQMTDVRGASAAMDPGRLFVSFSANSTRTPLPHHAST